MQTVLVIQVREAVSFDDKRGMQFRGIVDLLAPLVDHIRNARRTLSEIVFQVLLVEFEEGSHERDFIPKEKKTDEIEKLLRTYQKNERFLCLL